MLKDIGGAGAEGRPLKQFLFGPPTTGFKSPKPSGFPRGDFQRFLGTPLLGQMRAEGMSLREIARRVESIEKYRGSAVNRLFYRD